MSDGAKCHIQHIHGACCAVPYQPLSHLDRFDTIFSVTQLRHPTLDTGCYGASRLGMNFDREDEVTTRDSLDPTVGEGDTFISFTPRGGASTYRCSLRSATDSIKIIGQVVRKTFTDSFPGRQSELACGSVGNSYVRSQELRIHVCGTNVSRALCTSRPTENKWKTQLVTAFSMKVFLERMNLQPADWPQGTQCPPPSSHGSHGATLLLHTHHVLSTKYSEQQGIPVGTPYLEGFPPNEEIPKLPWITDLVRSLLKINIGTLG